jgi:hypothetical protein
MPGMKRHTGRSETHDDEPADEELVVVRVGCLRNDHESMAMAMTMASAWTGRRSCLSD